MMMTTAMRATSRPYSTAEAPSSRCGHLAAELADADLEIGVVLKHNVPLREWASSEAYGLAKKFAFAVYPECSLGWLQA